MNDLYDDALEWAQARKVTLPDEYYGKLAVHARNKAFAIAGIARLDLMQQVQDSLAAALESGQTFKYWKAAPPVEALGLPRHRLDNIFRTNIQMAYSAGIARNQERPGALERRPYFQYDAVNDSRTRPSHAALDNFIAPANDPIWQRITPTRGFRCRCVRLALSEAQARARGYDPAQQPPPLSDTQPDPGFAGHPLAEEGWAGVNRARAQRMERVEAGPVRDAFLLKYVPPAEIVGRMPVLFDATEQAFSLYRLTGAKAYNDALKRLSERGALDGALEDHEAVALHLWSQDNGDNAWFRQVNRALWPHSLKRDDALRKVLPLRHAVASALGKLRNDQVRPDVLYRGVARADLTAILPRFEREFVVGNIVRLNGFTAASAEKSVARDFARARGYLLEFVGFDVFANIAPYSVYNEGEWLAASGLLVRVVAIDRSAPRTRIVLAPATEPAGGVMPEKNFAAETRGLGATVDYKGDPLDDEIIYRMGKDHRWYPLSREEHPDVYAEEERLNTLPETEMTHGKRALKAHMEFMP